MFFPLGGGLAIIDDIKKVKHYSGDGIFDSIKELMA
jgi:hypothetical protein